MNAIGIIIVVIAILIIFVIVAYNSLIALRNKVQEAFSTMDVYLKKRWDLIPNLIETVKGYTKHESETLEKVVELRNSSYDGMSNNQKVDLNNQLTAGIRQLLAVAENYPDLKANQSFIGLSNQLSQLEGDIANSRKYYNATVRELNNKIEIFPTNIVAKMFNFKEAEMFEVDEKERENVKVQF